MAEKPGTDEPRTLSGKRPSATSLQREREYIDWLSTRAIPEREGMHDDSWAAFMAKRRGRMEKLRLPRLSEWRKEQRHQRGMHNKYKTAEEWHEWRDRERARLLKVTRKRGSWPDRHQAGAAD